MDRIDPLYYAHSTRIDLKDETRIKADSAEAEEWRKQNEVSNCKHLVSAVRCTSDIEPIAQRHPILYPRSSTSRWR